jgi:hypothetical protein
LLSPGRHYAIITGAIVPGTLPSHVPASFVPRLVPIFR